MCVRLSGWNSWNMSAVKVCRLRQALFVLSCSSSETESAHICSVRVTGVRGLWRETETSFFGFVCQNKEAEGRSLLSTDDTCSGTCSRIRPRSITGISGADEWLKTHKTDRQQSLPGKQCLRSDCPAHRTSFTFSDGYSQGAETKEHKRLTQTHKDPSVTSAS